MNPTQTAALDIALTSPADERRSALRGDLGSPAYLAAVRSPAYLAARADADARATRADADARAARADADARATRDRATRDRAARRVAKLVQQKGTAR